MFFRRIKAEKPTFDQQLSELKSQGYTVESASGGGQRVSRNGFAIVLKETADGEAVAEHSGLVIGKEIGRLVNGGYQMFFRTESGVTQPARAEQLKALHNFQEDVREALGATSHYNQGLGTTTASHLYDRVQERDHPSTQKAWQK